MSSQYIRYPSSSGGGVSSINSLSGAITLAAGSGISITPAGNTLTIATTSGVTFPLLAPDGSVGAPSYSWSGDPTTGFWNTGSNVVALSVLGTNYYAFSQNAFTNSSAAILNSSGSSGAPSYSFSSDSDTGIWNSGSGSLDFTVNASEFMQMTNGAINNLILTKLLSGLQIKTTSVSTNYSIQ